jgi:hypothetical protein
MNRDKPGDRHGCIKMFNTTGVHRHSPGMKPRTVSIGLAPGIAGEPPYLYRFHTVTNRSKPGCVLINVHTAERRWWHNVATVKTEEPHCVHRSYWYLRDRCEYNGKSQGKLRLFATTLRLDAVMSWILSASPGYTISYKNRWRVIWPYINGYL